MQYAPLGLCDLGIAHQALARGLVPETCRLGVEGPADPVGGTRLFEI